MSLLYGDGEGERRGGVWGAGRWRRVRVALCGRHRAGYELQLVLARVILQVIFTGGSPYLRKKAGKTKKSLID